MKRNMADARLARKRKKAGASYGVVDLDALTRPTEKVEDIRVWDVTMSETTGRVSGTRRNYKHTYKVSPEPVGEEPSIVEISAPADTGPSDSQPAKPVGKNKRVRIAKENDSVSSIPMPPTKLIITRSVDEDGRLARTVLFDCIGRAPSEGRLG